MIRDTRAAPRLFGAGDPVRQQQQQLLQTQLQQQRLEQHAQHQQFQQHLQRQQLLQHQLQQQLQQQQWASQLSPSICPPYSYPLSSAVSPSLLTSTISYPQPNIMSIPPATSAECGVSTAGTGPPPLSLRDILHILGESVAVLECLRVLLLQLLHWGGEVGVVLRSSSLVQHLLRFSLAARSWALCRLKRSFSSLSLSPSSSVSEQQPPQQQQGGQQLQLQHREPLLRQAWQLTIAPFIKLLSLAAVDGEPTLQGRHKGGQSQRANSLSILSKTAAAAGTIVATISAAPRRGGGLLKLLSGRVGSFLYGALLVGVLYRIFLQWRKYRRLLKRYRRLIARASARRSNRVEDGEEAVALMAAELESGTRELLEENAQACHCKEGTSATEIFATAATTAAASGADRRTPVHRDASMQTQDPDTMSAATSQERHSASARMGGESLAAAGEQQPPRLLEEAAGWRQTTPVVTPWTVAAATAATPMLGATPTASFSASKAYTTTRAGHTHPGPGTTVLAPGGSAPGLGSAALLIAASQQTLPKSPSQLAARTKSEAILAATPRVVAVPLSETAVVRPSQTAGDAAAAPRRCTADAGTVVTPSAYIPPSACSGGEGTVIPAAVPAATNTSKEAANSSQVAARSSGELLLRQFLQARMQQVKDPSKAALCAVSLDSLRGVTTPAETAPTQGTTSTGKVVAANEPRTATKQPFPVTGELVAEGEPGPRAAMAFNEAGRETRARSIGGDGVSSAGELLKMDTHLRQRRASWADGVAAHASSRLVEASRKAVAALAAARLPRSLENHSSRGGNTISQPQLLTPNPTSSSAAAAAPSTTETAATRPVAGTAFGLQRTCPVGAGDETSPAVAREDTPSFSRPVTVTSAARVSSRVLAAGMAPQGPETAPNSTCRPGTATASTELAATDQARKQVSKYVEDQLRSFKAAEKRATPAFRGNPFLNLCHVQQQRAQQEERRLQLLEKEFNRTDIPPWERGSNTASADGEQDAYTPYWKASFFPRPHSTYAAPPWSPTSRLHVHAAHGGVMPQATQRPEVLQQMPQLQAQEHQDALQQVSLQPHKKEGVMQREEDWLPTQLPPPDHSPCPLNDPSRASSATKQPASVPVQALLQRRPPTEPHTWATQTALAPRGRVVQPFSSPGAAAARASLGAAVADSHEATVVCHLTNMSPPLRRSSDSEVKGGRTTVRGGAGYRFSACPAAGGGFAAAEAEAAAGPAAATGAANKAAAAGAAVNVESPSTWLAAADTPIAATDGHASDGKRQGCSTTCPDTFKVTTATRQEKRRSPAALSIAGEGGGAHVATEPPTVAVAGRITAVVTAGGRRPQLEQEDYFAGTASVVRRQQETRLRQLLQTHTLHQRPQERPWQHVHQQRQHQLQQQGRKDCIRNGTPSTASDADRLAELAAAATRDGGRGRYYYPELYV